MPERFFIECLDCGYSTSYSPTHPDCPRCYSQWRQARYDLATISRSLSADLAGRRFDLWRYRELLPVSRLNQSLSLGEGGTPLIHAQNLGTMLGCPHIYIKDERQGPTNSFKDRQAAVGVAALKEAGITEAVIASTGNVAIAYSAYAARAGIKLWAFLTSLVPAEKMREISLYGTRVIKVTGTYDQAKKMAAEFAQQRGLFLESGSRTIPSVEAMKTIAYEIAEQTSVIDAPVQSSTNGSSMTPTWRAPDWYFQSVSGGLGPLGVQKGFLELHEMGYIDSLPAMGIIQAEGCSPMVQAWKLGNQTAKPVEVPSTHIATLATGDPGRTYSLLFHNMQNRSSGLFESVSDEETFNTIHILAKMEGLSVEPAAAVAFAGLIKLVRIGRVRQTDVVVVNCTGHTMPVEEMILGNSWSKNVEIPSSVLKETPREGLLAALQRASVDRFPRIEIVDDTPDARRLIRRILQSQGEYTIYEASNGKEAIDLAKKELPDLIILDLMMPEIDGFSVLDSLKDSPETASIPVIVVTAKELTTEDLHRLSGRIRTYMQKGEFMDNELLEEVKAQVG